MRGVHGFCALRRFAISALESFAEMARFGMSIVISSPFFRRPIRPPSAASGETCPTHAPCVAPLKRPSVMSATLSPSPAPMM